jgi:hypothetical protein
MKETGLLKDKRFLISYESVHILMKGFLESQVG